MPFSSRFHFHRHPVGRRVLRWLVCAAALPAAAWGHGSLHDRICELTGALAEKPDDPALHFALAEVYGQHGEWEPALTAIARVEALAPGAFPTDVIRSQALLDARQPAAACRVLDRFLATHPTVVHALALRARAHVALGNIEAALTDYRAATAASPRPDAELALEAADTLAGHGCNDEARTILAAALAELGPLPPLLLRALELDLGAGRFDAALLGVAVLQKSAPRPEPWMARRAEILARAGRISEARAAWQTLIKHLNALPNLERGQPAISRIAREARQALVALETGAVTTVSFGDTSKPTVP